MYAIQVDQISKCFKLYYDKSRSLKEKLLFSNRNRYETRTVLNTISFSVKKGEAIGLIGENGCGKSTLLKIINTILYPDAGSLTVNGRISSLIELGAGFHPDMSGRENIYTNAAIFGLNRAEINQRIDEIVEFSELGDFIDNPIRTYSSGMYMRLAFSVAINVSADILLIDEILAVGDMNFQRKCYKKLVDIKENGVTIIMVSHDMNSIQQICERCIWLNNGTIEDDGLAFHVINRYFKFMDNKNEEQEQKENENPNKKIPLKQQEKMESITICKNYTSWGSKEITFKEVYIRDIDGKELNSIPHEQPFCIDFELEIHKPQSHYNIGVGISGEDGRMVFGLNTDIDHFQINYDKKELRIRFKILGHNLGRGEYKIHASIGDGGDNIFDWYPVIKEILIESDRHFVGICYLKHEWEML